MTYLDARLCEIAKCECRLAKQKIRLFEIGLLAGAFVSGVLAAWL